MALKFTDTWNTCGIVMFQVPTHGEEPGEEMIDFLNTCPHAWDGDDCGINMTLGDVEYQAGPGDWVCRFRNEATGTELWSIVDATVGKIWHTALTAATEVTGH